MSEKKLSYYEQLKAIDVITPVYDAWTKGQIKCNISTGKFSLHREIGINRPWTFASVCTDRKCAKWLDVYHRFYKILSPPCKQCWKVVYAPVTITELLDMQQFQQKLGWPGKCGTEQRDYTSGLGGYRAFWYCPFYGGLEGGRKHFQKIKNVLIDQFGAKLIESREAEGRFFLKRGCTEYERDFGPSNQWDKIDHSAMYNILETVWEDPAEMEKEWPPMVITNRRRWIELAVAHNDQEVLNYVKGPTLGIPSVKYQDSEHSPKDFKNYIIPLNGTMQKEEDTIDGSTKENLFGFESAESQEDSGDES